MKSFSQWAESISSGQAAIRANYKQLGTPAAVAVDQISAGLLELARLDPTAFNNIVNKIRTELNSAGAEDVFSAAAKNRVTGAVGRAEV